MAIPMQFLKVIKSSEMDCPPDVLYAVMKGKCEHKYSEADVKWIIKEIDNGGLDDPAFSRREFEKARRALSIARDGGLQSILNPGRY